jgi:hypothetical protein
MIGAVRRPVTFAMTSPPLPVKATFYNETNFSSR